MSVKRIILRGRGLGPAAEGAALVSAHGFSARYDLDRWTGVVSRREHDLYGQSLANRIVVFTTSKGGVATSWALMDMRSRGVAPAALIFDNTNPVMVQGAAVAGITVMAFLDPPPSRVIRTGDWLRLLPEEGIVEVVRLNGGEE